MGGLSPNTRFWITPSRQFGVSLRRYLKTKERIGSDASFPWPKAGLDPRDEEQSFRAELNQYLAYTYLRFKHARQKSSDPESPSTSV